MVAMHEVFEHTADLGIRARAPTLADLMAEAGLGLQEVIAGEAPGVRPTVEERFAVPGHDPEWLLLDWLGELLAAFELRRMLFCRFEVTIDRDGIRAHARGEPYDSRRHELWHEVKAITHHGLRVRETPQGWEAEVIVDI
jgi:SHS2 domain-containing protein